LVAVFCICEHETLNAYVLLNVQSLSISGQSYSLDAIFHWTLFFIRHYFSLDTIFHRTLFFIGHYFFREILVLSQELR